MRLKEIVGARLNEAEAVRVLYQLLLDIGYPQESIVLEKQVAPGRRTDIAILDPGSQTIKALVEVKACSSENRQRRLMQAKDQLLGYVAGLPQSSGVRAFVALFDNLNQVVKFEFHELLPEGETIQLVKISKIPKWDNIFASGGEIERVRSIFKYSGKYATEREILAYGFSVAREKLHSHIKKFNEFEAASHEGDAVYSVMGEIESQLNLRFSNLRVPAPWRTYDQLFQSVAMFGTHLVALKNSLINDADGGSEGFINVGEVIDQLINNIRSVLKSPNISKFPAVDRWLKNKTGSLESTARSRKKVDLLIITAMDVPEYEEVLGILDCPTIAIPFKNANSAICHEGRLIGDDNGSNIVCATQNDMGLTNTAVLATKLITYYRPRFIAMVGIAAGIDPKGQKVGDILCASHTYDIALGKLERDGVWEVFKPKIYQNSVKQIFKHFAQLEAEKISKNIVGDVRDLWNKNNPGNQLTEGPDIHIGPLGSGGTVIADPEEVARYKKTNNALIGFEMEAHAIATAAVECGLSESPQVAIFKSVCDFAGKDKKVKKDIKQRLAAFTSAQFLRLFFLRYVLSGGE